MDRVNGDSNVLFSMDGVRYMIAGERTSELVTVPEDIITVPSAPSYIIGISNPYGKLLIITDLRQLLGYEPSDNKNIAENMLIVLKQPDNIGFLVDRLISDESLSDYYRVGTNSLISELVSDFYKNDKNKNIVTELNVPEIVSRFELDKVLSANK